MRTRAYRRHCEQSQAIRSRSSASGLLRRFAPRNDAQPVMIVIFKTWRESAFQRRGITLRLSYRKSQRRIYAQLLGGERKEVILGTFPALKPFRHESKEIL